MWESTSFQLERLQAAEATVSEEQRGLASRYAFLTITKIDSGAE